MTLTARDLLLLEALCGKVRLLAWEHVRLLWPEAASDRAALKRLSLLIKAGLLLRRYLQARPVLSLEGPAAAWQVGSAAPDFHELSRRLQARWKKPPGRTTVYVAAKRAANLLGGTARGRVPTAYQASHDLGLSSVYMHYLVRLPDMASQWVGEDLLPAMGRGLKRPDAELRAEGGQTTRVIEFGAGYPAARLEAFHWACWRKDAPYEIW